MIAGRREINKGYYKFNPIPLRKDASVSSLFMNLSIQDDL